MYSCCEGDCFKVSPVIYNSSHGPANLDPVHTNYIPIPNKGPQNRLHQNPRGAHNMAHRKTLGREARSSSYKVPRLPAIRMVPAIGKALES